MEQLKSASESREYKEICMKCRVGLIGIILLAVVLSYGTPVHSAMTGKEFLQDTQSYQNGFINGFVRGMYLTCLDHMETKKEICSFAPLLDATFDMTPDQVLDLFLNYIRKNTENQQKEVSDLLVELFERNCKEIRKTKVNLMNLESYYYNCSPDYIDSIDPSLHNQNPFDPCPAPQAADPVGDQLRPVLAASF